MNILIVTEFFPPENHIASFRLYSFAKYWQRAGHNITVLTTLKNKSKYDLNFDFAFLKIIRLAIPFSTRSQKSIIKKIINKLYHPLEKIFSSAHFPSLCDLWARKVLKLINAFDYDVVLSSGPPYSVHRVGLALKAKNKYIKWVVDWRDLWTKEPFLNSNYIFISHEIFLENKFHENADLITTVSEPLNKILSNMTSTTIRTIYNGFEPDDFVEIQREKRSETNIFKIVFTGTLYRKLQDVSPLFETVSHIKKSNISLYNKIQIQFAGRNSDVIDIAQKYDILETYSYLGFISREESQKLQYNADMVLFFDFKNTVGILSGKIFEYIKASKEIIVIGNDANSAAAELIKKTNTGVYLGSNVDLIEQHLINRINNKNENVYIKNDAIIQEFTRENQANKLLNYILQLDTKI